uniref:T9SS type A sorting domain-containing protein n=1 Tax=Winogradskyella sp. A2 TaxID=3366944 RepID=UPI00398C7AB2
QTLSQIDQDIEDLRLYYAMGRKKIVVMNPNGVGIAHISVTNILGQRVYQNGNAYPGSYNEYDLQGLTTGIYIVQLTTDNNAIFSKKIVIN